MNKKNEKETEKTVEKKESKETSIASIIQGGGIAALLKTAEPKGFSLTCEYLKMEEGEKSRYAAMQMTSMIMKNDDTGEEKEIECILLIDEDNKTVAAGQMVIVNALKKCLPQLVEIEHTGVKDLGKGKKLAEFTVIPLGAIV